MQRIDLTTRTHRSTFPRLPAAFLVVSLLVAGCFDDLPTLPPEGQVPLEALLTSGLQVDLNPEERAPLSARVSFRTRVPASAAVEVLGDEPLPGPARLPVVDHAVPVLGLYPDRDNQVEIRVEVPDGAWAVDTFLVLTDPLPDFFPEIEILTADPGRMEPGWTLSNFSVGTGEEFLTYPFMFDANGDVRWYLDLSEFGGMAYLGERLANGNLGLAHGEIIREYDMLGGEVELWETPGYLFHHDLVETPDGNLIVLMSRADLETVNDQVIEVDRQTGEIVTEWDLREALDVNRRDYPPSQDDERNWLHTNAVWYDAADNAIIVSARNQTAVVKLSRDNEVVWILGAHQGWGPAGLDGSGPETSDFLLTAVDEQGQPLSDEVQLGQESSPEFRWPWGQHTPVLLPDRRILVFDNGLQRDFTGGPGLFSRGVEYQIDEESMTVRQTWQYGEERGVEYFSSIISNVDHLPGTGNRLIAPGITGGDRAFVTEVTYPTGEVVFEARIEFKNELSTGETAWGDFDLVYRSRRLSLYP